VYRIQEDNMAEVIGVRFKEVGKIYYFDPIGLIFKQDDKVIVETARGIECGTVALANKDVEEDKIVHPLKSVLRKATDKDLNHLEENKKREKDAFKICEDKIREHNLEMKLVDVEYTFDNNKILFYFTADGRVDFRALVKDLATVFRTRIELRQIGVRDEAKMLGGLGVCGRPFCCSGFLGEFQPVSIKMAKEQGLSLSPVKISGTCGRLMCCLKYEQDAYTDLINKTPKVGQKVKTPDGIGTVVDVALLTGTIKVKLDGAVEEAAPQVFNLKQLKTLGGKGCCCKNQEEIPEFLPETDEDDFDEFISEYFPENKSQSKGNRNTGDKPIREEKQEKRQNYRGNNKRQNYQNKGKRPYRNNRPKRDNNRNKNDNRD
jgi:cell fate regulator YaaT (PSP1 superfamily)